MVAVLPREELPDNPLWTVSCERCSADLSADFSAIDPIQIVRLEGDIDPSLMQGHLRSLRSAWDECKTSRRPLIYGSSSDRPLSIKVDTVPSLDLQRVLAEHAKICQG